MQRTATSTVARGLEAVKRGAAASAAAIGRMTTSAPQPVEQASKGPFLVVGHRGSPRRCVENTLPSMRQAVEDGANAVEIDLSLTKDGVVALWHDWDPNDLVAIARQLGLEGGKYLPRAPKYWDDARRRAHELTLDELRKNYGYQRSVLFFFRKRVDARIPTLREFFEWATSEPRLEAVFLDVKIPSDCDHLAEPFTNAVCALIDEFEPKFECVFMTPHKNVLRAMKPHAGTRRFSWDIEISPGIVLDEDRFSGVRAAVEESNRIASIGRPALTYGAWSLYQKIIESDVEKMRAINNDRATDREDAQRIERLIAWTINARNEHVRLLRLGVDGILTDMPRRLERLVRKHRRGLGV